jgi:hypothetical protein
VRFSRELLTFISGTERATRFTQEEITQTFSNFIRGIGDVQNVASLNSRLIGESFREVGAGSKVAAAEMLTQAAAVLTLKGKADSLNTAENALLDAINGNVSTLQRYLPELRGTGVSASQVAAIVKRLSGEFTSMPPPTPIQLYGKAMNNLKQVVGDVRNEMRDKLLAVLTPVIDGFTRLANIGLGRTAIQAAVLVLGFIGVVSSINNMALGLSTLIQKFEGVKKTVESLIVVLRELRAAQDAAAKPPAPASPVGAGGKAGAGLAAAALSGAAIAGAAKPAGEAGASVAKMGGLLAGVSGFVGKISAGFASMGGTIIKIGTGLLKGLGFVAKMAVWTLAISAAFQLIGQIIDLITGKRKWEGILSFLKDFAKGLLGIGSESKKVIKESGDAALESSAKTKQALDDMKSAIERLGQVVPLTRFPLLMKKAGQAALAAFKTEIEGVKGIITEMLRESPEVMADVFKEVEADAKARSTRRGPQFGLRPTPLPFGPGAKVPGAGILNEMEARGRDLEAALERKTGEKFEGFAGLFLKDFIQKMKEAGDQAEAALTKTRIQARLLIADSTALASVDLSTFIAEQATALANQSKTNVGREAAAGLLQDQAGLITTMIGLGKIGTGEALKSLDVLLSTLETQKNLKGQVATILQLQQQRTELLKRDYQLLQDQLGLERISGDFALEQVAKLAAAREAEFAKRQTEVDKLSTAGPPFAAGADPRAAAQAKLDADRLESQKDIDAVAATALELEKRRFQLLLKEDSKMDNLVAGEFKRLTDAKEYVKARETALSLEQGSFDALDTQVKLGDKTTEQGAQRLRDLIKEAEGTGTLALLSDKVATSVGLIADRTVEAGGGTDAAVDSAKAWVAEMLTAENAAKLGAEGVKIINAKAIELLNTEREIATERVKGNVPAEVAVDTITSLNAEQIDYLRSINASNASWRALLQQMEAAGQALQDNFDFQHLTVLEQEVYLKQLLEQENIGRRQLELSEKIFHTARETRKADATKGVFDRLDEIRSTFDTLGREIENMWLDTARSMGDSLVEEMFRAGSLFKAQFGKVFEQIGRDFLKQVVSLMVSKLAELTAAGLLSGFDKSREAKKEQTTAEKAATGVGLAGKAVDVLKGGKKGGLGGLIGGGVDLFAGAKTGGLGAAIGGLFGIGGKKAGKEGEGTPLAGDPLLDRLDVIIQILTQQLITAGGSADFLKGLPGVGALTSLIPGFGVASSLLGGLLHAASGTDQIVRRPKLFLAGEAGPERVTVTPQGRPGFDVGQLDRLGQSSITQALRSSIAALGQSAVGPSLAPVVAVGGPQISVQVHEATPLTWVRVVDEKIAPRLRQRQKDLRDMSLGVTPKSPTAR